MQDDNTTRDLQWRARLSPEAYRVTRQGGTEPAFSGEHYRRNQAGDYLCVCCGALLFHAETKFDAGCGWPSFWQEAVPGSILRLHDNSHGLERTEVRCAGCNAHLGHVFADGPLPSGERYCINSVAIDFKPG